MAYAFNDDKTKYDLDGALAEIENTLNSIGIETTRITVRVRMNLGTRGSHPDTNTAEFDIPDGYIPIAIDRFIFNESTYSMVGEYVVNKFNVDFTQNIVTLQTNTVNVGTGGITKYVTVGIRCIKLS